MLLTSALMGCAPSPATPVDNGWVLAGADEFEGPAGASPDPTKWGFDVGGGGWGNDELQFYTDRPENASLDGDGHLVIRALAEDYQGAAYTSARLKTQGKFAQAYGRFEVRVQLPEGAGLWPAFWLLGDDFAEVGWPSCGEIDIMEFVGANPAAVFGNVHGPGYSGGASVGATYTLPSGTFGDGMHVFAVEWDPQHIAWIVDDVVYSQVAVGDVTGPWVFDHPFFVILNLAIGGTLGGPVDAASLPAAMVVDYVRIYRRVEPVDTGATP